MKGRVDDSLVGCMRLPIGVPRIVQLLILSCEMRGKVRSNSTDKERKEALHYQPSLSGNKGRDELHLLQIKELVLPFTLV